MKQNCEQPKTEELISAYADYHNRRLSRSLMVANGLSISGVPIGMILDLSFYPGMFWQFFAIRACVVVFLLAVAGLVFLDRKSCHPRRIKTLAILAALSMNFAVCLMMFMTDGARSPYDAGLNLIITCWAVMLPWAVLETSIMCLLSFLGYVVACVANPTFSDPATLPIFLFNCVFILITTLVCIGISFFLSRVRFEEFRLRYQIDIQNRELQDMDRLKTQFFSNISHELRTPLTLILGPVESLLARAEPLDARVHEGLSLVHRNALRLLKLINELLDLMRLEEGAEILRKRQLSLGAYLRGIVDSVKHLGLSKKLKIHLEKGNEDDELFADPARMEKVLLNLLTNAIKYTPPSGTVTVGWKCTKEEARIHVADTGIGIPARDLAKIFDRFHQVRCNVSNQVQGVGIGLALAKDLVTEHGGRIEVESRPGIGSRFSVILPRAAGPDVQQTTLPDDKNSDGPFEKAFRSADRTWRPPPGSVSEELPLIGNSGDVVLVADDEGDMLQYLVSLLSTDCRIVQTRSGDQVAGLAGEHRPAMIILDWMMPGRDGLSICRELRAKPELDDIKILLLTARIDEESRIQALGAGADDFLTKPFSPVELRTKVFHLLHATHLKKELQIRNTEISALVEKLDRAENQLLQGGKANFRGALSAGLLPGIHNPLN